MIIDAQGKLLIAPPGMPDPRFRKTVVFMWKHDVSGAAGVVINKRCQRPTFAHVCKEGNILLKPGVNPPVYYGGPILNNVVGGYTARNTGLPARTILPRATLVSLWTARYWRTLQRAKVR